jgi:hypothetical protein
LDLYTDYPKFTKAREICEEYLTYPILAWRNKFIDIVNQLAEFDGEVTIQKIISEENKKDTNAQNEENARKQEFLNAGVEGTDIKITYKNLS